MKLSRTILAEALWQFSDQFVENYQQQHGHLPVAEFDELWLSPCQQATYDDREVLWQPVEMPEQAGFDNVEAALDIALHPDIKDYFCCFYSDNLPASCDEGELSLLFAWNFQDFQRLQENLIGHIVMKQKLKQPLTVFFAVTDEDDLILSMNNADGSIWVERVGCAPHKQLANSMVEFIESLRLSGKN